MVETPVNLTKKLLVPLPDSLLLKVAQSAACSWPVLAMEAKGKLRVKVEPEILPLKILPVVPVARVVTPVSVEAMVMEPAVEVVMVMLLPWIKVAGPYLVPVESAARSWPCWVGAVVVPVPPLAADRAEVQPKVKALLAIEPVTLVSLITKPTRVVPKVEEAVPPLAMGRMPETSAVKEAWPMLSSPLIALTMPLPKEERVVEPTVLTFKNEEPVVEATTKIGRVWEDVEAWTTRLP